MAISKSAKIEAEIEKVKAKIAEQQARLKELEQKKAGGGKQRDRGHRAWHEHFPHRSAPAAPVHPERRQGCFGTKCPEV